MFILSAAAAKRKEKVETNEKVRSSVIEPNFYYSPVCVTALVSCGEGGREGVLTLEQRN